MMLAVNDHIFGSPREVLCVVAALAVHVPLYFWHARPDIGLTGDPITEIEFKVEEEELPPPPPPVEHKEVSFFKRIQEAVGLSTPPPLPKLIIQEKPKNDLMGMDDQKKISPSTALADSMQKQNRLVNKDKGLSNAFDVGKIETKTPGGLAGVGLGSGGALGGGTLKEKSAGFKIASSDLPFAVKRGAGDLTSSDADAPRIALANRTDKRVTSVSTEFFGSGGGTGGGDGSGEGGGGALKDKSGMKGLAGVSGGTSLIGAPGTDGIASGSGRAGLVGSPTGSGRDGASEVGGAKVPYEISGTLSGRRIVYQLLPSLPDWAREKGLLALVRIQFFVRYSGEVNSNKIIIVQGSGYPELDKSASDALARWRFAPLEDPAQKGKEQSGLITFKFRAL